MARRSRSARSALALCAALAAACAAPAPPPAPSVVSAVAREPDLTGTLRTHHTVKEDTLIDLARDNGLGYIEVVAANPGVDPWLPGERDVVLPTARLLPPAALRKDILINIAEQRLYYFGKGGPLSFAIGVGREGINTPLGVTSVTRKREKPSWYPGPSARHDDPTLPARVPPGPDNPLGEHAVYLGWPSYLIHGTNEPFGIGRRSSRGCVRLYPEDIKRLFPLVKKGMQVRVINEPVKLGWSQGELYLEVHPTLDQAGQLEDTGHYDAAAIPDLEERIRKQAANQVDRLDWELIKQTAEARLGVPVQITRSAVAERELPLFQRFLRSLTSTLVDTATTQPARPPTRSDDAPPKPLR